MNASEETETADESPLRTVRERTAILDVCLLLSVPVALLAVASLPLAVRESFAFEYADPTLATALVSPFVHLTPVHLGANLAVYALVVPAAYLLSVTSGQRRRFRVVFVSLVLACPLTLSYLNLAIVRQSAGVGFSGVLMALYGYLPLTLATYLDRRFGVGRVRQTGPLLFFVGLLLMTTLTLVAVRTHRVAVPLRGAMVPVTWLLSVTLLGVLAALALTVALYVVSGLDEWWPSRSTLADAAARTGYFELAVVSTVVFLTVPIATFPVDPVVAGSVVNLYVHVLGYALGFIGAYATVLLDRALFATSPRL
ncbi:hypothetical protein [Haloarcula nitratireducens]|uniref:Peptidase S54 rhomboid domain-containing protein n=1 Tax=Haloarcula nitratireducens TaxID=2487749 RepID=A0AAW4PD00_9EURY|nr:hypothetical protein [Halomicroarcula nitratireducens]MBX0295310.1 hypothetical protein [Halomicroarcula nitratireducens]